MDLMIKEHYVAFEKKFTEVQFFHVSLFPNEQILSELEANRSGLWFNTMLVKVPEPGTYPLLHRAVLIRAGNRTKVDARMKYIGAVKRHIFGGLYGYLFVNKDAEQDEKTV